MRRVVLAACFALIACTSTKSADLAACKFDADKRYSDHEDKQLGVWLDYITDCMATKGHKFKSDECGNAAADEEICYAS